MHRDSHTWKRACIQAFSSNCIMNRMRMISFCVIAFSFVISLTQADDCKCSVPDFAVAYKNADAIFTGQPTKVEKTGNGPVTSFSVKKMWMGKERKDIEVTTAPGQQCVPDFELDKEYLVYAAENEDHFLVEPCSRTVELAKADSDLKLLQQKQATDQRQSTASRRDPFSPMKGDRLPHRQNDEAIPRTLNITNAVIIGLSKKGDEYFALIRAADGRVYTMKAGDRLYDGKILKIDSRAVTFGQYSGYRMRPVKKYLRPFEE